MVTLVDAPTGNVLIVGQVTMLPAFVPPADALEKIKPVSSKSCTTTFDAVPGPAFVIVTTKVKLLPKITFVGPANDTCTSAAEVTVVRTFEPPAEPLLLFVFASGVDEVLDAMLVNDPLAGAVSVSVKFTDAPLVSVTPCHVTALLVKV
jgi:hypothetical protein